MSNFILIAIGGTPIWVWVVLVTPSCWASW